MDTLQWLRLFLAERCVHYGKFRLSSGRESSYYINATDATLNGHALNTLSRELFNRINEFGVNAVGGPETGAIPLATAVCMFASRHGLPMEAFFVRKQGKSHGNDDLIEGKISRGDRVALLDDVTTSGASIDKAIDAVTQLGAEVVVAVSLVDRDGGAAALLSRRCPYRYVFAAAELVRPDALAAG